MIRALARARWERIGTETVTRQKKDALFELAARIAQVAEAARNEGDPLAAISAAAAAEKRKSLRHGLRLLAEGADGERLDLAFDPAAVLKELDSGSRLELSLIRTGLNALSALEHPVVAMRRMTAWLGPEYFDKVTAWAIAREAGARKKRRAPTDLLVPGDLPDIIRDLAAEPPSLDRALRSAGRGLSAAALAGCPPESMKLARAAWGPVGGQVLEEDAEFVRGKLSGDEIAQAQGALVEIVRGLEERGELELTEEEEFYNDPAWVDELTRAIMSVSDRSIRAVFSGEDKRSFARAMQGMAPEAHERILGLIQKRDSRRLLDAVDDAAILPRREVIEAGRALARAFIARAEKPGSRDLGDASLFARLRDWESGEDEKADRAEGVQAEGDRAGEAGRTAAAADRRLESAQQPPATPPAPSPGQGATRRRRSAADRFNELIGRRKG